MPRLLSITLCCLCIVSVSVGDESWPQFRGPGGEGHCLSADLPIQWSETENITWKVPVEGSGFSSPVVADGKIWMTTAIETPATPEEAKKKLNSIGMAVPSAKVAASIVLKAVCFDLQTGKLLHDITLFNHDQPLQYCAANSLASPTPILESGRLYCDFGTMGTVCLDTATCKPVWKRALPIEHQVGPGSTPIIYNNLFVLVRDGCHQQYVTALDKTTGETVWKTDRPAHKTTVPEYKKSFSTPLVIDAEGGKQLVIPGARWIVSYEPDTGRPIWQIDTGSTFSNATRPVFGHGMVYVSTAFGGSELYAIRVDGTGDVTDSHIAWTSRKQVARMPSPVMFDDILYTISDNGAATCYDALTGDVRWSARATGRCWASPIIAKDRIYFFGEDGTTVVICQNAEDFEKLSENELDGRILASPAVIGNAMLLRTDTHLYRIEASSK